MRNKKIAATDDMLRITGFEQCDFPPDETSCDKCNEKHRQLYFGNTSYWDAREGNYYCLECLTKLAMQIKHER